MKRRNPKMKRLKTALALDWDVRAKIEQEGVETIDTWPYLHILFIGLLHFYLYVVVTSVVSRNFDVMEYRFANGLYSVSFEGFLRLFW
jgi:hypothetical protein